jgi:hypothetical protein
MDMFASFRPSSEAGVKSKRLVSDTKALPTPNRSQQSRLRQLVPAILGPKVRPSQSPEMRDFTA